MNSYNYDDTLKDLTELKRNLHNHPEQSSLLLEKFKKQYPFTSSNESLLELLNDSSCSLEIITKLLIQECRQIRFSNSFYEMLDRFL